MAIYRNPVPGQSLPRPLRCVGSECVQGRTSLRPDDKRFTCPNHEKKGNVGGCETRAFTYPRGISKKGGFHYHQGIDIGNTVGQTIVSVVDGIVVTACDGVPLDNRNSYRFGGYGKVVIVKGKNDGLYYFHAHCAELLVKEGDEVFEQMPIAKVGMTAYTRDEPQRLMDKPYQPHLHFEVSSTSYARGKAKERTTEDHRDHPDLRMDPLQVLEKLGPWGAGRKFFLPTGEQALRANLDALSDAIDRQAAGGYFPIGANNFWHGGIHLHMPLGATVHAPMSGRVVAARLDEQEEWVYRDFGSTNFVLIRHELTADVARQLRGEQEAGASGGNEKDSAASEKPASAPADAFTKRDSVGEGGTNQPELVKMAVAMLRSAHRPASTASEPATETRPDDEAEAAPLATPYYAGQTEPASGADPTLVQVIRDFQTDIIREKSMSWSPDGRMTYKGTTWRELERKARVPPPDVAAGSGSAGSAGAGGAAGDNGGVEQVYSLFMHLDVAPLNDETARRIPWLARVAPSDAERQRREAERAQQEAEFNTKKQAQDARDEADRVGADHKLSGNVGLSGARRNLIMANSPSDVLWVKARLRRYGYYEGTDDLTVDAELARAIGEFQKKHVDGYRGKANPPSYVSPKGKTRDALRLTRVQLGIDPPLEPLPKANAPSLSEAFAAKLRERDGLQMTKVVTELDIPIEAGEPVWTVGYGTAARDENPVPFVHWSVFSERALLNWQKLEDPDSDFTIDGCDKLIAEIQEQDGVRDAPGLLSKDDVGRFYASGRAEFLRHTQAKFCSEWGASLSAVSDALSKRDVEMTGEVDQIFGPYTFWSALGKAVPAAPHVWHYHPLAFIKEVASVTGALTGTIRVEVFASKTICKDAEVVLLRDDHVAAPSCMTTSGFVSFERLEPGPYRVEARTADGLFDDEVAEVRAGSTVRLRMGDPPPLRATDPTNPFRDYKSMQLTRLREGDNRATLSPHLPKAGNSGVTLGYGFDVGGRDADDVERILRQATITDSNCIAAMREASGKQGARASSLFHGQPTKFNWSITPEQREALLAAIWPEYQRYASARAASREVFQAYDFYIQELLTDFAYVGAPFAAGDGGGGSRHKVNALLAAKSTDMERMEALRDYVTNLPLSQQKTPGKKLRLQYIDAALEDMELA